MKLLSKRGKSRFITSKAANLLFMVMLFTLIMFCVPTLAADDILTSVKSLLSKAAIAGVKVSMIGYTFISK